MKTIIQIKDKLQTKFWARMFFAGYFVYGLIMSSGGGKLEPLVDCLLLMSLVLWQEKQHGKAMFTLGLSVQTKIYSAVVFPVLFLANPVSSIWFIASMFVSVIPSFFGASFDSLISHFLNTSSYSVYIVNPMFPGLTWGTPNLSTDPITYFGGHLQQFRYSSMLSSFFSQSDSTSLQGRILKENRFD